MSKKVVSKQSKKKTVAPTKPVSAKQKIAIKTDKPTSEQVKAQIKALEEIKPRVRRFSFFGDDNWKLVEIQIQVLQMDMDDDEIYDYWDTIDMSGVADAARQWLDGKPLDSGGDLVDGWKTLVVK